MDTSSECLMRLSGLQSFQGSTVAGYYAFNLTQVAIGRRLSFFAMWVFPQSCSQYGFLQSKCSGSGEWASNKTQEGVFSPFYLISEVTYHSFCHAIGHTHQRRHNVNSEGGDHWGLFWSLINTMKKSFQGNRLFWTIGAWRMLWVRTD